jgi:hypothetical protein
VICGFHAGLLEGLLEGSGTGKAVIALGFQGPTGCAYALQEEGGQVRLRVSAS